MPDPAAARRYFILVQHVTKSMVNNNKETKYESKDALIMTVLFMNSIGSFQSPQFPAWAPLRRWLLRMQGFGGWPCIRAYLKRR